jgi:outer membrane protein assembly factor BamD
MQYRSYWLLLWMALLGAFVVESALAAQRTFQVMGITIGNARCEIESPQVLPGEPADLLKKAASKTLTQKHCEAAQIYQSIAFQYPHLAIRHEAEFLLIPAHLAAEEYDAAITAAKNYLKTHPRKEDERVEYAYYAIGFAFFAERNSDDVRFNQRETAKAQQAFVEYLRIYPNGKHAHEVKAKLELAYNILAEAELEIGKSYLERARICRPWMKAEKCKEYKDGLYLSAAVRLQQIPTQFRNSRFLPEAIALLVECFQNLGKKAEADAAVKLLERIAADSEWTKAALLYVQDGTPIPVRHPEIPLNAELLGKLLQ